MNEGSSLTLFSIYTVQLSNLFLGGFVCLDTIEVNATSVLWAEQEQSAVFPQSFNYSFWMMIFNEADFMTLKCKSVLMADTEASQVVNFYFLQSVVAGWSRVAQGVCGVCPVQLS